METGQKPLADLFAGTGLGPSGRSRRRILKKARRLGRSKKKWKGSSSSSAASGSDDTADSASSKEIVGGLFNSERRMRTIWRRYPGGLAATSPIEARHALMTASGLLFDTERKSMPPRAAQFTRQHLAPGMSPPNATRSGDNCHLPGWAFIREGGLDC